MNARWLILAGMGSVGAPLFVRMLATSVPVETFHVLPGGAQVAVAAAAVILVCTMLVSWFVSVLFLACGGEV